VRNLLDNATKYTAPGGRVTVAASIDGPSVVLHVTDTGIGMDPDVLERAFEPFARGDASATRARGGLGVGLSLVRAIAELHGGTVHARSAGRGCGSDFELCLPLDAAPIPRREASGAAPFTRRPRARHILLVEDNRDAREVLRLVLELDGHKVETAADGLVAVRLAAASAPDVVLIDIGLPQLDGYEVGRRIRKRLGRAVRLVALTGYGDRGAPRQASEVGFDAYVVKPVAAEDLSRLLAG
jgi:CheY-like chemotaxis protein